MPPIKLPLDLLLAMQPINEGLEVCAKHRWSCLAAFKWRNLAGGFKRTGLYKTGFRGSFVRFLGNLSSIEKMDMMVILFMGGKFRMSIIPPNKEIKVRTCLSRVIRLNTLPRRLGPNLTGLEKHLVSSSSCGYDSKSILGIDSTLHEDAKNV